MVLGTQLFPLTKIKQNTSATVLTETRGESKPLRGRGKLMLLQRFPAHVPVAVPRTRFRNLLPIARFRNAFPNARFPAGGLLCRGRTRVYGSPGEVFRFCALCFLVIYF